MEALLGQLRKLDAHPKTRDEFKVRTLQGGLSTVVAAVVALWLVRCELRSAWTIERRDKLYVNSTHGATVRVSFDVEFPNVACELIGVDAMDQSGQPMEAKQTVKKAKLDPTTGRRIVNRAGHDTHATGATATQEVHFSTNDTKTEACGDCYGAQDDEYPCCESCDDVRKAYRRKGWTFRAQTVTQCQSETTAQLLAAQNAQREGPRFGCAIFGDIILPSVSGNFHFAPGRHIADAAGSVSATDLLALTFAQFNVSHVVKKLRFLEDASSSLEHKEDDDDDDDEPEDSRKRSRRSNARKWRRIKRRREKRRRQAQREHHTKRDLRFSQLEGVRRDVGDGYGMHQYYLKVVPTTYVRVDGTTISAAQYSVTEHVRHVAPGSGRGLPGVFFFYEVSPVCAEVKEHRDGLPTFLVGLSAIVGGVYVTFGLLDRVITALFDAVLDGKLKTPHRRSGRHSSFLVD